MSVHSAVSFYRAFLRALWWRPGLALEALYWHVTGRKVRARNRLRIIGAQSPFAYQLWIENVESTDDAPAVIASWDRRPLLSVIFHDHPALPPGFRERTLASLRAQHYRDWELVLVRSHGSPTPLALDVPRLTLAPGFAGDRAEALGIGINAATGEFVLPLPSGAVLPPAALYRYAQALRDAQAHQAEQTPDDGEAESTTGVAVLYGDHDEISGRGYRDSPWFKPRWNPEMFLAQDYISPACVIRTADARAALPIPAAMAQAANYALVLAVTRPECPGAHPFLTAARHAGPAAGSAPMPAQNGSRPSGSPLERAIHIPHILAHLAERVQPDDQQARAVAVAHHLARCSAAVQYGPFGSVRVDWPLPEPRPLVSIIIPTRDQVRLLRKCVLGVLGVTRYKPFEIIIVDNGSREPETLTFLRRVSANPRVRVLDYDRPFNFSAINNFAVQHARGSYLCLLNNDIEIIDDQWLTALMRQAVRPEIGAAGGKLLYEDGTIQHAGVVIGLGDAAGHAHRFQRDDHPGYFARAHVAHCASAVTAACLVVEKAKFEAVGGLDEANLAVAFNDVDFCLKLERAGWRNVFVPQATAIHHESKSRGRDFLPANVDRYLGELAVLQNRWSTRGYRDPLHHPHLDLGSETYVIQLRT
jgi:GT2 family glycosyltransferase